MIKKGSYVRVIPRPKNISHKFYRETWLRDTGIRFANKRYRVARVAKCFERDNRNRSCKACPGSIRLEGVKKGDGCHGFQQFILEEVPAPKTPEQALGSVNIHEVI